MQVLCVGDLRAGAAADNLEMTHKGVSPVRCTGLSDHVLYQSYGAESQGNMKGVFAMQPLIGVCASHDVEKKTYFVRANYMDALLRAGGLPVLLPMTTDPDAVMDMASRLDGLFLAGGGDVDPARYGEEWIAQCGEPDPLRDAFELELVKDVRAVGDIPIFGVCRGIQVLNVALGGTLYQDIPVQTGVSEKHMQDPPYDARTHVIEVVNGSLLHRILGTDRFMVNSTHHQAIHSLAPSLAVDARSPEGIIEAVHSTEDERIFGVQFHPEHFAESSEGAQALFNYFVKCAGAI